MNRLIINSKYENRYLLTEEISFDPKTGNQVWAVVDSETGKRLLGRFQANGNVEWFDDTRPQSTNKSKKVEQNKPFIDIPSNKPITNNQKTSHFVIPPSNPKTKQGEKNQQFLVPQNDRKSTNSNPIKSFENLETENRHKTNKVKTKLPIYIGLSLLGVCVVLIGYDKKELILSKISQPKVEVSKVDSTVTDTPKEKVLIEPLPNLPKNDIEPSVVKNADTLKPKIDSSAKISELKNEISPKKVKRKKIEEAPKRLKTIKF